LIDGLNKIPGVSIPPIKDMVVALRELGSAVRENIDDFIQLGITAPRALTIAEAEAERFKVGMRTVKDGIADVADTIDETAGKMGEVLVPTLAGLTAPAFLASPMLEYGRRMSAMGRAVGDELLDAALQLRDMFGYTLKDAADRIALVKLRELDRAENREIERLAGGQRSAGGGLGGGVGWAESIYGGDTALSIGLAALGRGENPSVAVQVWLDGKDVTASVTDNEELAADVPTGGPFAQHTE